MTADPHDLVMVFIPPSEPDNPIFRCACWGLASGVSRGIWTITLTADRKFAAFAPSVNWPGHFHAFYSHVPVAGSMAELAINPDWAADG